jgi:hypothetical protein
LSKKSLIVVSGISPNLNGNKMSNYQIVLKIPIEALDDIEARQKMKEFMDSYPKLVQWLKAQRIFTDKAPEKLSL